MTLQATADAMNDVQETLTFIRRTLRPYATGFDRNINQLMFLRHSIEELTRQLAHTDPGSPGFRTDVADFRRDIRRLDRRANRVEEKVNALKEELTDITDRLDLLLLRLTQ